MRGYIRSERIGPAERMATCRCGLAFGDDGDGRAAHQVVHGHRPVEKPYIEHYEPQQIEEMPRG